MKKLCTLLLPILIVSLVSPAQQTELTDHRVIYDFSASVDGPRIIFAPHKYVSFGNTSTFAIKGINTLLYDITINGESIDFNSGTPAVFELFLNSQKFDGSDVQAETKAKLNDLVSGMPAAWSNQVKAAFKKDVETIEDAVSEFKTNLESLEQLKDKYNDLYAQVYSENTNLEVLTEIGGVDIKRGDKIQILSIRNKCKELLNNVMSSFDRIEAADTVPNTTRFKDEFKKVRKLKKQVDAFDYKNLFQSLVELLKKMEDPTTTYYFTQPIVAEKDLITYSIEIKPKSKDELKVVPPTRTEKFTVPVYITGGTKIDFSTGIAFGVGWNRETGTHDRSYKLTDLSSDADKGVVTENPDRNNVTPSLAAFMHVYRRRPDLLVHHGPTFGLGLNSTDLSNAQFFLGYSAIFGNNQRFILNGGLTAARVDFLKPKYQIGDEIPKSEIKEDKDLTEKTTRLGLFISFSYNITAKKKSQ